MKKHGIKEKQSKKLKNQSQQNKSKNSSSKKLCECHHNRFRLALLTFKK